MQAGEKYRIYNHDHLGQAFIEGSAILLKFIKKDSADLELWEVQFLNRDIARRWVNKTNQIDYIKSI